MGLENSRRRSRWVLIGLLFAMVLAGAAGAVAKWPLWSFSKLTQAQLAWSGIHGQSVMLDGLVVHYLEGGSGKPVVFVHGVGGKAQDWRPLLSKVVRAGFHVYAMDLPGFGETAKPRDRAYSVREQAAFVEAFLNAMGLDQVRLVGVSMGGWITAKVALDEPKRVERLVLLDSAGFSFKPTFDPALFAPKSLAQVDALLALLMPRPEPIPSFIKEAVVRQVTQDGWVIERALSSMESGVDILDSRFPSMEPPLLLIWGKQDAVTPLTLGEAMHKAVPDSVLEIFDDCGHLAFSMCADRIAPRLIDFLATHGPPPGTTVEVPVQ